MRRKSQVDAGADAIAQGSNEQSAAPLGPRRICFGPSPEEADSISCSLWGALGILLAHEVLFGRERPGVCAYAKTDKQAQKTTLGVQVSGQPAMFTVPIAAAERLLDRWMLAVVVGVRQSNGDYKRFLAPSDLARLALEHTPALQEFVRHCVSVAQRSAA